MKHTWKAFLRMPVEDRVRATAEIPPAHRCGPRQDGTVEIVEALIPPGGRRRGGSTNASGVWE
jgi:hypothetical protein